MNTQAFTYRYFPAQPYILSTRNLSRVSYEHDGDGLRISDAESE